MRGGMRFLSFAMTRALGLPLIPLLLLLMAGAAIARPGSKPSAPKLATAVNIENKRPAALQSFEIVMPGKDKQPEVIVGKLDKPLPPGGAASFPLVGAKGCTFLARWAFDDIKDAGDVNLCNDAHIVLVD